MTFVRFVCCPVATAHRGTRVHARMYAHDDGMLNAVVLFPTRVWERYSGVGIWRC